MANAGHPSHNFSSTTYTCYGCGIAVDDHKARFACPTPDRVGAARHPMQPFIKADEIDLRPSQHITYAPDPGEPVILNVRGERAEYRPTLPPVAHDPLNMREEIDLLSMYPRLSDLAAVEGAVWGREITDAVERALRKELAELRRQCANDLKELQTYMSEQSRVQRSFNAAYAAIEAILAKFPELLKP